MNLLFLGDVNGRAGRNLVREHLDRLIDRHSIDYAVANVENAADGFGVTPGLAAELEGCGLHVMTSANALLPASVSNLGQVETLPRFLALLLVLLSVVTIGHALSVSVRLRAPEVGTLRALGMTPRASAGIVATQALTIVGVAVAISVPVGQALAGRIWSPLATHAHVVVRVVAPGSTLATYVLVVVIATAALSVLPVWRTFRLRPGNALRAQ